MKLLVTFFSFFILTQSYSQEFSKKEIEEILPLLEKSSCVIRDFNKNNLISVKYYWSSERTQSIESAFFSRGFNVVSSIVAKESLDFQNPLNPKIDSVSITKSINYKAAYLLTCDFSGFTKIGPNKFNATIIDIANGGKLVASFSYSSNDRRGYKEDLFINAFIYCLSKNLK